MRYSLLLTFFLLSSSYGYAMEDGKFPPKKSISLLRTTHAAENILSDDEEPTPAENLVNMLTARQKAALAQFIEKARAAKFGTDVGLAPPVIARLITGDFTGNSSLVAGLKELMQTGSKTSSL